MSTHKDNLGSGFLYSEDFIKGGEYVTATLTIAEILPPNTVPAADKKMIDKPIMRFEKTERMLVLNRTNQQMVPYATGKALSECSGAKVTLEVRNIKSFGGVTEPAIRIVPPAGVKVRKKLAERLGVKAVWNQ